MASAKLKGQIAGRIKEARDLLRHTQKDMADRCGIPFPSYRDYELGKTIPGGEALYGFIRGGVSATWLLAGDGPKLTQELYELEGAKNLLLQAIAQRDELAESLKKALEKGWATPPGSVQQINADAFAAILSGIMQAMPSAAPERLAKLAVEFYMKTLDEGLIAPSGVGEGGNKAA